MLAGNIASFILGGIIATVTSFLVWHISFFPHELAVLNEPSQWPADFDWSITRSINVPKPLKTASSSSDEVQNTTGKGDQKDLHITEKPASIIAVSTRTSIQPGQGDDLDPASLQKAFIFASVSSLTLVSI
jgi:urea-proton symporter